MERGLYTRDLGAQYALQYRTLCRTSVAPTSEASTRNRTPSVAATDVPACHSGCTLSSSSPPPPSSAPPPPPPPSASSPPPPPPPSSSSQMLPPPPAPRMP
eukprot:3507476-Rhodomonas_salina.1